MNWTIKYKKGEDYVTVVTEGRFTVADHLKMSEEIIAGDFWRPGMNVLFDHRRLDFGNTGFEAMKKASATHVKNDARIGDGKAAILMKSVSDFGLGRQFEMLTDEKISANLHIFLDEKQARRWLNL